MIPVNRYYPAQMNGSVISAFGAAINGEFAEAEAIQHYLYQLSIDTADEKELESIGRIIGYIRPLVPEGFNAENILLLGTLPLETDLSIGLSTVGENLGGQLSTISYTDTGFMDLGIYRKFLKSIAVLKRFGITLASVDTIVSVISKHYTIDFDDNCDIVVHFTHDIGYKNIWILTQIFYRTTTSPQVLITSGG